MNKETVVFKGSYNKLTVHLDEKEEFKEILNELKKKLKKSKKFFSGTKLNVGFKGRTLSEHERQCILDLFKSITGDDFILNFEVKEEQGVKDDIFKDIEIGITRFKRGTVRSGQQILSEGNLVVIGDVNPGAELVAAGNVIVMGVLRGIVHAGCDGNRDAIISALGMHPTQLRIADIITRSPDGEASNVKLIPEIAFIKEGRIYIEELRKG